jgi:hypothetical protein
MEANPKRKHELSEPNEEYKTRFFTMLQKCVEHYNNSDIYDDNDVDNNNKRIKYNKLMNDLTTNVHLSTDELRKLNIELDYSQAMIMDRLNKKMRAENDRLRREEQQARLIREEEDRLIREEEDRLIQMQLEDRLRPIRITPSENYPTFNTYDFGSVRSSLTEFDVNFNVLKSDKSSVLLFIAMHGELMVGDHNDPKPLQNEHMLLNKFSMASPGHCAVSSFYDRQYVLYAMCDAEKTGKPLDILTMYKEAHAHIHAKTHNIDGITAFDQTPSPLKFAHDFSLKKQLENQTGFSREAIYDEVLGGDTYRGNIYYDKYYSFGDGIGGGIFICSADWPEIGAVRMDNLLENEVFITWMSKFGFPFIYNSDKLVKAIDVKDAGKKGIGITTLNLLTNFCIEYRRFLMNIVDDSCSLFNIESITLEQATDLSKTLISQKEVAKGIKRKSKIKGNNKSKRKSKRKDNNKSKSKRKGRKGNNKSKKKRQVILHRFNKSIP